MSAPAPPPSAVPAGLGPTSFAAVGKDCTWLWLQQLQARPWPGLSLYLWRRFCCSDRATLQAADARHLAAPPRCFGNAVVDVMFPCDEWASIVFNALAVDAELQPDKVSREMSVHGPKLRVGFAATEARLLRAAYRAFMDVLILATRTLEQFGEHLRQPQ
eukprot:SM000093S24422  [mRNA]  locus=s93:281829:282786:- [translate_table: standard]